MQQINKQTNHLIVTGISSSYKVHAALQYQSNALTLAFSDRLHILQKIPPNLLFLHLKTINPKPLGPVNTFNSKKSARQWKYNWLPLSKQFLDTPKSSILVSIDHSNEPNHNCWEAQVQ